MNTADFWPGLLSLRSPSFSVRHFPTRMANVREAECTPGHRFLSMV